MGTNTTMSTKRRLNDVGDEMVKRQKVALRSLFDVSERFLIGAQFAAPIGCPPSDVIDQVIMLSANLDTFASAYANIVDSRNSADDCPMDTLWDLVAEVFHPKFERAKWGAAFMSHMKRSKQVGNAAVTYVAKLEGQDPVDIDPRRFTLDQIMSDINSSSGDAPIVTERALLTVHLRMHMSKNPMIYFRTCAAVKEIEANGEQQATAESVIKHVNATQSSPRRQGPGALCKAGHYDAGHDKGAFENALRLVRSRVR